MWTVSYTHLDVYKRQVLHSVGTEVRVLEDINSLVTLTEDKNELFQSNQTIRVLDQIAMDIASLFNTKYRCV